MSIPGTLTHSGPTAVPQASIDEIPNVSAAAKWLVAQSVAAATGDPPVVPITHTCHEAHWTEEGYEQGGVWFMGDAVDTDPVAASLAAYGFDLYDQGSGKWYALLPDDRVAQ